MTYLIQSETLVAIANAIRAKHGYEETHKILVESLASEISTITTGVTPDGTATASQVLDGYTFYGNGTTKLTGTLPSKAGWAVTPTASSQTLAVKGYYLTSDITVNAPTVLNPTKTYTANGTYTIDTLGDVFMQKATVNVAIASQVKTATANGTVTPDSGYMLSSVVVAIPEYDGGVGVLYSVTADITNGSFDGESEVVTGDTYTATITADQYATLPSTITVTGGSYTWDSSTGIVTVTNVTGDVTITAVCKSLYDYTVTGARVTLLDAPYSFENNEVTIL